MMVKTHGMMMSAPMIHAYLAGLKSQTRRIRGRALNLINANPDHWDCEGVSANGEAFVFSNLINRAIPPLRIKPPYGPAGDTLWFRETYGVICNAADPYCECETEDEERRNHTIEYRADTGNPYPGDWPEEEAKGSDVAPKWQSSMFMPHAKSRFVDILILNVRVERLQKIGSEECMLEGIALTMRVDPYDDSAWLRNEYKRLWNKLNGKKLPWEKNPWVWVYEFPKYQTSDSSKAHFGDPCIYCHKAHNDVAVGDCPNAPISQVQS